MADPLTIALGAGKLLGGLFGKKKTPNIADQQYQRISGLKRASDKFGVNFLELIRGPQGGTIDPGGPSIASPTLFQSGFDTLADALTGEEAEQKRAEEVERDLDRINRDEARRTVPTLGRTPLPGQFDEPTHTVTNPYEVSSGTYVNPRQQDAEASQTRTGEIGELVHGASNVVTDYNYNRQMQEIKDKYGEVFADEVHRLYGTSRDGDLDFWRDYVLSKYPHYKRQAEITAESINAPGLERVRNRTGITSPSLGKGY